MLDNPLVWEASRVGLDLVFGLYRDRRRLLRSWEILEGAPSVLDIGCGIGQYSLLTSGRYVGVDLNARYIDYARRRRGGGNRTFRCADAGELVAEGDRFDLVLLIDFLHHLDDAACGHVLDVASALALRHVVVLDPVRDQVNRLGRWFIDNDRGEHMRTLDQLDELLRGGLGTIERSVPVRLGSIQTRAYLAGVS